ncbi:MAG TPA: hypothetical protein VMM78_06715 [Thermomicrobiales bacterium]|nr:hypothetical protein [Thermomicrobiales bacterium]
MQPASQPVTLSVLEEHVALRTMDAKRELGAVDLSEPGAILLVSCYELGHQPLNLAMPMAYLRRAGYDPRAVDTAVESLEDGQIAASRFVAISAPMHTALRLGTELAGSVRALNPGATICYFGLYAWMNADYLLRELGDYAIGGEAERALLDLIHTVERGDSAPPPRVSDASARSTRQRWRFSARRGRRGAWQTPPGRVAWR